MACRARFVGPTFAFGFGLLLAQSGMLAATIFLDLCGLDHLAFLCNGVVYACRQVATFCHLAHLLGRRPLLHKLLAVLDGLFLLRGHRAELLGSIRLPYPDVAVV